MTYNSVEWDRVCVCVPLCAQGDSMQEREKEVCVALISSTGPRGSLHGGLNLSLSSNTLPDMHTHTRADNPSPDSVAHQWRHERKWVPPFYSPQAGREYELNMSHDD